MVMLRVYRPDGHISIPIPEEGIYDDHGHLFHHVYSQPLLREHNERLAAHGIIISMKKVSKEEDQIIRTNWDKFRRKHNLEEIDILRLVGFAEGSGNNRSLSEFRRQTNFWVRLCDGLPHRSASTVRRRVPYTYDIHSGPEANRGFTEEDDLLLLQLRKLYPEKLICVMTGRNYAKVHSRLVSLTMARQFSHSERRKLWNIVVDCHPGNSEEWKIPSTEEIYWNIVSSAMSRSKETLQHEWTKIIDELKKLKEEGDLSFVEALDKVAPMCPRISAADFSEYLLILLHLNPSIENLYRSAVQDDEIHLKLKEHGITGFLSGRYSEAHYCRILLGRILRALRRRLLRPSSLRLSFSTQIRLLSHSFRCLPQATQSNGPLRLDRNHVIRQIEKLMETEDANWKMSGKMKKYIEGERK